MASRHPFHQIRERIDRAALRSGRRPDDVVLVGASKRQPLERLHAAYEAGLRHFGENLVQEVEAKRDQMPGDVVWHLLGPLQSNKVRRAARSVSHLHAVDRLKIARALGRAATEEDLSLEVFLEVNLGAEPSKHGFAPSEVGAAAREIAERGELRLLGLMAIPPPSPDAEGARRWFRELRELSAGLRSDLGTDYPGKLSMGMSADFEVAVEEGATHVRVGTALFGSREHPVS